MACSAQEKIYIILMLALVLTIFSSLTSASKGKIGVDYGLNGDNLLAPHLTVALLASKGVKRVRIYEARADVIRAFANSGIDLIIGVPNEEVPRIAANVSEAFAWVTTHVLPFPTSRISAVLVGNEWLSNPSNDPSVLVPAMQNIHTALSTLKLFLRKIKVSTSHSFDVLSKPSFPPSKATFAKGIVAEMRPLLAFLLRTRSFFMVNIFPYFAYLEDPGVSLEFALFESTTAVTDPNTGLNYTNLFDLQLDAVYAAIASLLSSTVVSSSSSSSLSSACAGNCGDDDKSLNKSIYSEELKKSGNKQPPVHSGESGWPSKHGGHGTPPGGKHNPPSSHSTTNVALQNTTLTVPSSSSGRTISGTAERCSLSRVECAANALKAQVTRCACTVEYARTFNQNLIRHVLRAKGTPAHPRVPIQAYIFELFNEDLKPPGTEQHYGLFFPNGTAVYPINFHDRG